VVEQPLDGLYSFLRTLLAQGRLPSTRLLGYRITVDSRASPLLTGAADGLVYELSRLRLVDDDPFVVETIYFGADCGAALPHDRLTHEVLYDLMRECCGLDVTRAEETLRPVTVEQPEASLLGLQVGEPVFLVERTGYAGVQAVELRRSIIRGDRYRFRVLLEGHTLG
jgi:GntR family transcriptional regulator